MSIFKKIGRAVKKVTKKIEDKVIEPLAKDAIPLTAAYFTGGTSLSVLKPSSGGALNKLTGGLSNSLIGGFGGGAQEVEYVEQQGPLIQQQQGADFGASSLLNSIMGIVGNIPSSKQDVANSPQVGSSAPQVTAPLSQGISPALMLGVGGGLLAVVAFLIMGKK